MAVLVTGEKLEILITEAEIASRINTLSEQISKAYEQTDQLVVIGLLRGSFCLLYTSPSPRDRTRSRMPSSA